MKKVTLYTLIILIVIAGIGLASYPMVANYLFEKNATKAAQEYDKVIAETELELLERAMLEAVRYNESLEGNPVHDPFLEGSGMALSEDYEQVLNLMGDGIMGFVSVPKIGVRLPIYHGTSEEVLQKGTGHLVGSSLPVGGLGTHSVITGHTGLSHAKIFTDLTKLVEEEVGAGVEGDIFFLHILDQTLAYKVDQIKKVWPENTEDLKRASGKDYSTLVTCWPYGVNSHRLMVRGTRIEYDPEEEQALLESGGSTPWYADWHVWLGAGIGLAVVVVFAIFFILFGRRKKEENAEEERRENPWAETKPPAQSTGGRNRKKTNKRYWWDEDGGGDG